LLLTLAGVAPVHAAVHVVTLDGMSFTPADITIYQGDAIRFENVGGPDNLHNVRADDDHFICSLNCTTNHAPSTAAWQVTIAFNHVGTFGYYCEQHGNLSGGMRGSITVIDRIFVDGFEVPPLSLETGP
jgi:plastocyanin